MAKKCRKKCGSSEKFLNDENSDWIKCAVIGSNQLYNAFNKWSKGYTSKCEPAIEFIKDIKSAIIDGSKNNNDYNLSDTYYNIDLHIVH